MASVQRGSLQKQIDAVGLGKQTGSKIKQDFGQVHFVIGTHSQPQLGVCEYKGRLSLAKMVVMPRRSR